MASLLTDKTLLILDFVKSNPSSSSKKIHSGLNGQIGYSTIKRILVQLISEELITASGVGKGTRYEASPTYDLFRPIDVIRYFEKEVDEREIKKNYSHSLIKEVLETATLFTKDELDYLSGLQQLYRKNSALLSEAEYKK